ncbi:hypothetical protein G7B40_011165 [Aetokthonos hydrillicola Thurmond2011]|jgi:hypothetical protein|uniref:Uncharacterized protein n=1 Tax=Aetokthonos hydrillicola Thurmond2011 TaxID=2712845 RepID=A0AAP5I5E2_9CYAN|nr:hypothetical protein [Aetokthonos hydrillicola]MBO3459981.1 hypothetical protein [Aetokthonos hydrillicola CCALA 1050]MBW4584578.1 hypothetical protein [Aetokthonos hydrillicola CCALA 1050]MDR9895121.1 hypothetical protein [Aetokthonos hydrillicola Thurmond2011]
MPLINHIFQIILFSVIFFGPAGLSLAFTVAGHNSDLHKLSAYHLLSFLTIWSGIQVCIALLLGLMGQFNIWTVLWMESMMLVAGLGLLICSRRSFLRISVIRPLSQQLTATPELTLIFYITSLGIILFLYSAVQPIIDSDSLWYHLPSMARWYQDFSFTKLPEFARFTAATSMVEQIGYYPYTWEAFCTLFILPFKEDFLVTLPNLIAWVMLGLSIGVITYGIREQRGFERASIYGDTYKYVSEKLKPGEKIGYIFSVRSYLLYGKNLDKKVVYLSSCSLNDLHRLDISFIALGPFTDGNFSSTEEADCILNNPNLFTPLLHVNPNFSQALYKISVNP